MPMITPNFHFDGQCKRAMELYVKAFGARVTQMMCNSDADARDYTAVNEAQMDFVYHAEMMIGDQRVMLTDTSPDDKAYPRGNSLSLVVTFDTADEVRAAFAVMADGAVIIHPMKSTTYSSCFVSLIDRYGMRWELMTEQTQR